ncbi:YqzL family protein [Virgibacillus sp. MSJ-26]|uniref:YqzL family protein n=1 Tax=Virgibacillus sp. MSJ-26 TaxID=2841522 RepID=UPI001C10D051|nr:YqzL family protein [Virgibacillus sp. MSJ-26]
MIDVTWKLFSQTGNIEAYLLLRELEGSNQLNTDLSHASEPSTFNSKEMVYKPH